MSVFLWAVTAFALGWMWRGTFEDWMNAKERWDKKERGK